MQRHLLLFFLTVGVLLTRASPGAAQTVANEYYCGQHTSFKACYDARGAKTRLIIDQTLPIGSALSAANTVTLERRGNGKIDCGSSGSNVLNWAGPIDAGDGELFDNCPATAISFTASVQREFRQSWFDSNAVATAVVPSTAQLKKPARAAQQKVQAGTAIDCSLGEVIPVCGSTNGTTCNAAITMTANPAIANGVEGETCDIVGEDTTNTVTIPNGLGVVQDAPVILSNQVLPLRYSNADWRQRVTDPPAGLFADRPASPRHGQRYTVTNASGASSCTDGDGVAKVDCFYNAATGAWEAVGGGGGSGIVGLQAVLNGGQNADVPENGVNLTKANSLGNSFCVGKDTDADGDVDNGPCFWNDDVAGAQMSPRQAGPMTFGSSATHDLNFSIGGVRVGRFEADDGLLYLDNGLSGAGSSTQTTTRSMRPSTVAVANANAFAHTVDATSTNPDFTGIQFVDNAVGSMTYLFKVPTNLAGTPAWKLEITHKSLGAETSDTVVVLDVACNAVGDDEDIDAAATALEADLSVTCDADGGGPNQTVTTLSTSGDYDSEEPLAAGDLLVCVITRDGDNAPDTLGAAWLLLDASVKYNENT